MSILYEVVYKGWNDTDDRSSELRALTIVNGEPTKGTGRKNGVYEVDAFQS